MQVNVTTDELMLRVTLADGRESAASLEFFPRLRDPDPGAAQGWKLLGGGCGIPREELDEDPSVRVLLRRV